MSTDVFAVIDAVCKIVATIGLGTGAGWSAFELTLAARDRRSEWMWRMNQDFNANEGFKVLRQQLETPSWEWTHTPATDDFLNFLETVAILCDTGQFQRKYAHSLFGYWVEALGRRELARKYLRQYGYAHLLAWVEHRPYQPTRTLLERIA